MHYPQQQNMYDLLVRLADEAYDNIARPTVRHMSQSKYGKSNGYTSTLRYLLYHNYIKRVKDDARHAYRIVR